jgi:branched-chain amino acid transport system permease protein
VRGLHVAVVAVLAALVLVSGTRLNAYVMHVAIVAMFYATIAASWSLLSGYAGLFSLGHMAFASLGGYTSALLVQWSGLPVPVGMAAGVALTALGGGAIGWICLRMSGPYLAIFTLAFAEILRITLSTENQVTAGMAGLHTTPLFHSRTDLPYYYTAFVLLAVSLAVMGGIVHSRWGLFFRAIREDEQAAAASGVDVVRFKITAFAVASSFAGLAGAFYAHYIGILTPSLGSLDLMGLVVAMTIIGGLESIPAAVGGAVGVETLQELLRSYAEWRLVLFGAILLCVMRFARNGLLAPLWHQLVRARVGGLPRVGRRVPQEESRL